MLVRVVGIDFGTTNSAVAVGTPGGEVQLARFAEDGRQVSTFRSVLYVDPEAAGPGGHPPRMTGGADAIRAYLETGARGRLIQSIKAHLGSPWFSTTRLYGADYRLEELVGALLVELRRAAEADVGPLGRRAVVGRPVRFAGARSPDDETRALARLRAACAQAGFDEVSFALEPVAAAHEYRRRLRREELVLIADFGGGTSDFSLVRIGPAGAVVMGVEGIAVAGDAFDARLVRHAAAPGLGRGSRRRTAFGRVLPMPTWLYDCVERWDQLSFLRSRDTQETLRTLHHEALEPEKVEALIHLVEHELGWLLHREIEGTKVVLSSAAAAEFVFRDPPLALAAAVERGAFERWIAAEVQAIGGCVDALLARTGTRPGEVATVFLTGGSSFVPIVRQLFAERFGPERLRGGEELTTVAKGLAVAAAEA